MNHDRDKEKEKFGRVVIHIARAHTEILSFTKSIKHTKELELSHGSHLKD